jgi:hypothetical protein
MSQAMTYTIYCGRKFRLNAKEFILLIGRTNSPFNILVVPSSCSLAHGVIHPESNYRKVD